MSEQKVETFEKAEVPQCLRRFQWVELDLCYTQTSEASTQVEDVNCTNVTQAVKAIIKTAFIEGKTMNLSYVFPAHSVVVQALLNMNTHSIRRLYSLTTKIESGTNLLLKDVVTADLNPLLLEMSVDKFIHTVELLYYVKEYFLTLYGVAVINVTCKDREDVLIILSQTSLCCNVCCESADTGIRLFQCLHCNVSSVCEHCLAVPEGQKYLTSHNDTCGNIQKLLQPIVNTMSFVHLCCNCFTPLHKNCKSNHFNPQVTFEVKKKKRTIVYKTAKCTFKKCVRDVCNHCFLRHKNKRSGF